MVDTQSARSRLEPMWIITGALVILAAATLALALQYTRVVMLPFVLAIFVVSLVAPIFDHLVLKRGFPRPIAVVVTLLIVLAGCFLFSLLALNMIESIISTASGYSDKFTRLAADTMARIEKLGLDLRQEDILPRLEGHIVAVAGGVTGVALSFISTVTWVTILVLFLLAGRNPAMIRTGVYAEIDQQIRQYIGTKIFISTLTGLMVWATLALIGLESAFVFGVLAFLLNFIPTVGSIIATLLPLPIAAAQFDTMWPIIAVIVLPGTANFLIGSGLEPKLLGRGLNLHPVTIILSLTFWALLWGIPGALLATPMTAIIRIVLIQFDTLRPLGDLLAGKLPGDGEQESAPQASSVTIEKSLVGKTAPTLIEVPAAQPAPLPLTLEKLTSVPLRESEEREPATPTKATAQEAEEPKSETATAPLAAPAKRKPKAKAKRKTKAKAKKKAGAKPKAKKKAPAKAKAAAKKPAAEPKT